MSLLLVWSSTQTVLVVIAVIIVIVLVILMSTKTPGPEGAAEDLGPDQEETNPDPPEVEEPAAEQKEA